MPITTISRDWGVSPSIVRMTTSDDFNAVTAAGYLAGQLAVIEDINHGAFEFLPGDVISIYYADGNGFFTRNSSTGTLIAEVDIPPGSITTAMIEDGAVTYPKIQDVSANQVLGQTGVAGVVQEIPCTAAGRAIIGAANAAAQRAAIGAGTIATQNANAVALTGGTLDGISATTFTHTTGSLGTAVTAVTQPAATNNTTVATTAYADNISAASAPIGATYITQIPNGTLTNEQALSALATGIMKSTTATGVVSIAAAGTDYVAPATTITVAGTANEITSSAGAQDLSANRTWTLSLPAALTFTGKTITGGAYDGASATNFTFTTGSIGTAVTAVTQAASNNSTLLATTAYADNQVGTLAANKALSNLASVAINTSLLPASDNAIDVGDGTHRARQIYSAGLTTGTTAADTLIISARDVDGAVDTPFITLTAGNTPTCALASAVTATTQSPSNNSTLLATTAYVDAAAAAATIPGYTAAGAGNTTLLNFFEYTGGGTNYTAIGSASAITTNGTFWLPINTADMYAISVTGNSQTAPPAQSSYTPVNSGTQVAGLGSRVGSFAFPATKYTSSFALPFNSTGRDGAGIVVANDTIYVTLIYIPIGAYTQIFFNVIVADVSATADVDVAIYSPATVTGNSPVGARLVTGGTVSNISTTGEKSVTFGSTTIAGWHWIALRPDNIGTALTIDACAGTNIQTYNNSDSKTASVYGFTYASQTSMPSSLAAATVATYSALTAQLHVAIG